MTVVEMWREWVSTVGAPITAPCAIDLGEFRFGVVRFYKDSMALNASRPIWYCSTHRLGFDERVKSLGGLLADRCPVARLEQWRARQWELSNVGIS